MLTEPAQPSDVTFGLSGVELARALVQNQLEWGRYREATKEYELLGGDDLRAADEAVLRGYRGRLARYEAALRN